MGENADQLGHPGFPGLPLYQCFSAGKLIFFVYTMAKMNIDIQEVVRRAVANLHMPTVSAAQSTPPTRLVTDCKPCSARRLVLRVFSVKRTHVPLPTPC